MENTCSWFRPESYREDVQTGAAIKDENEKRHLYRNLASAAESGWDFSIRWFADNANLASIETTNIIPVDLNAFICYNLHILGNLHNVVGNARKSATWISEYIKFRDQFQKVFWVDNEKGWFDFNLRTKQHNTAFYASIAAPLFTQCYEPLSTSKADDLYNKLEETGVFSFSGGLPMSMQKQSTQQWDFPNGWPPLNHMMIEGLRKCDDPRMQQKAYVLAEKWILANYKVFQADKAMWEKYDVVATKPRIGGGGEYEVQLTYYLFQPGFGWTNGVALDLLITYGDRLSTVSATTASQERSSSESNKCFTALLIITVISSFMYSHIL
ncbi:unnamed protein product [Strongylus vulgaris]|uniref:Trehalase n=1 Tax=Strongylus vulgaris TaxID=40348 RepID=A0A3P7KDK1_STRVU|nr:unnamed protein product [Strongylus vulgaris]